MDEYALGTFIASVFVPFIGTMASAVSAILIALMGLLTVLKLVRGD